MQAGEDRHSAIPRAELGLNGPVDQKLTALAAPSDFDFGNVRGVGGADPEAEAADGNALGRVVSGEERQVELEVMLVAEMLHRLQLDPEGEGRTCAAPTPSKGYSGESGVDPIEFGRA